MSREREATDLGAACLRMMRALARRAGDGELEALEALASLQDTLQYQLGAAVAGYRAGPADASWAAVGEALGITRQSAHERFKDAMPPAPAAPPRRTHTGRALDCWRAAMDQWELDAEAASNGHTTELREWAATHPKPQLRDFMIHLAVGGRS